MSKSSSGGCLSLFFNLKSRKSVSQSDKNIEGFNEEELFEKAFAEVELPYLLRDDFLSLAERSFYGVLKSMMKDFYAIFTKVSLAEIFFVSQPDENYGAYNRINRKHIDFLICDRNTLKPVFAIELDDRSHNRPDRKERDEFVDEVFKKAGLPLLHIPVQESYNTSELGVLFRRAVNEHVSILAPVTPPEPTSEVKTDPVPVCPKCGVPMVLRTTKHGANVGKQFYGCVNFPKCREIMPMREDTNERVGQVNR